jgi:hypothetical protein
MMVMIRMLLLLPALAMAAEPVAVVVDFENAVPLLADHKANRVAQWVDKGVTFTLAHEPKQSGAKGMLMFFTHLASGRKGLVCAMATEPIPVRATFPKPVSSVTVSLWDPLQRRHSSKPSTSKASCSIGPASTPFPAARRQAIQSRFSA